MIMAQAGQYNLPRSLQRGNSMAAMLAAARFAEAALSMAFLLNRRYMPFYKWAGRLAETLPVLGAEASEAVEKLCDLVAAELRRQELCDIQGNWLWQAGPLVQRGVKDPELRARNVMED